MFSDSLEEVEVCKIAAAVHKSAMAWVKEHKIKYVEGRTENSQFRDLKKTSVLYPRNGRISLSLCQNQMIARHSEV
jgi:hypothetical protein